MAERWRRLDTTAHVRVRSVIGMESLLGRRIVAAIIDAVIEGVPLLFVFPVAVAFVRAVPDSFVCQGCTPAWCDASAWAALAFAVGPALVVWLANRVVLVRVWGASLGLALCGLEVGTVDGHRPGWFRVLAREVLRWVGVACLGTGVAVVCADGLAWHDEWTRTCVRYRPGPAVT